MKNIIKFERLVFICSLFFSASLTVAQNIEIDSLNGFNSTEAVKHASYAKTEKERSDFLKLAKRSFIKENYFTHKNDFYYASISNKVNAEFTSCNNIDFENNSTNGWYIEGDVKLTSGTSLDHFGGFPIVYPGGGSHSLQLNDNNITNKSNFLASASRVIAVSKQNNFLNLHFALAVLNYPHSDDAAAKFKIQILNSIGEVLECPKFDCYYFIDSSGGHAVGTPSFQQTPDTNGINIGHEKFQVSYSPWQSVGLDLTPYIGQSITVKISCDWCMFNYDWAYCYIDADCSQVEVPKYFSCGVLPVELFGPASMKKYVWIAPNGKDTVSKGVSCTATLSGIYTLYCLPNLLCNGNTLKYSYSTLPEIEAGFTSDKIIGFAPLTVNFTNTSVVDRDPGTATSLWSFGNGIVQRSTFYNNVTATTYSAAGTYTSMLLITKNTCIDTAFQIIEVEMPSKILIPDVFTPNGDGSNDVFFLKTTSLTNIKASIYDRWGNEVYESDNNNGNIVWDGKNLNGKECSAGIYFYVINATGKDEVDYAQKGNISLFR
jgi:gliding motility-associated-like protein